MIGNFIASMITSIAPEADILAAVSRRLCSGAGRPTAGGLSRMRVFRGFAETFAAPSYPGTLREVSGR